MRRGRETLVVTEGELNAVSIWQVLGQTLDVLSLGSETPSAAANTWNSPPTNVPSEDSTPSRRPPASVRAKT